MKKLQNYLNEIPSITIDSHIHLFNWKEPVDLTKLYLPYDFKKSVCFMDIEFDHTNQYRNAKKFYDNFIKNSYDKKKHILLATGTSSQDIIDIYNAHPDIIRGFGEIKCYDMYMDKKVPFKKTSMLRKICKFSSEHGNLPVYIHWGLNNTDDVERISNIIEKFPTVPMVLCHCGIDRDSNFAYNNMITLMNKYSNLWTDITYTALDFFVNNKLLLTNLPLDRLLIGTDLNNKMFGPKHDVDFEYANIVAEMNELNDFCRFDNNMKRLFKIKKELR